MDEQEKCDKFENLVGGPERAFRLLRLYHASANPIGRWAFFSEKEKRAARLTSFRKSAKQNGYTAEQIEFFLDLL